MQNSEKEPPKPAASDAPAPETPPHDTVLGQIGAGQHDSELNVPTPRTPTSHRKGAGQPPTARTPTGQTAPPDTDQLTLPRGGLVAMRESGGLRFRSREIVVYRSGKLVHRQLAPGGAQPAGHTRQAALPELVELHHLLKQIDFAQLPATGRQNPDAFAYEIVARVGRKVQSIEVFQGSIPASLAPLINELRRLMPADQENA